MPGRVEHVSWAKSNNFIHYPEESLSFIIPQQKCTNKCSILYRFVQNMATRSRFSSSRSIQRASNPRPTEGFKIQRPSKLSTFLWSLTFIIPRDSCTSQATPFFMGLNMAMKLLFLTHKNMLKILLLLASETCFYLILEKKCASKGRASFWGLNLAKRSLIFTCKSIFKIQTASNLPISWWSLCYLISWVYFTALNSAKKSLLFITRIIFQIQRASKLSTSLWSSFPLLHRWNALESIQECL